MKNLFWERHQGGKINHLVKWELVTKAQEDGGLRFGGSKKSGPISQMGLTSIK